MSIIIATFLWIAFHQFAKLLYPFVCSTGPCELWLLSRPAVAYTCFLSFYAIWHASKLVIKGFPFSLIGYPAAGLAAGLFYIHSVRPSQTLEYYFSTAVKFIPLLLLGHGMINGILEEYSIVFGSPWKSGSWFTWPWMLRAAALWTLLGIGFAPEALIFVLLPGYIGRSAQSSLPFPGLGMPNFGGRLV